MNAKKLFLGLLTATVVITPFATLKPASATDDVANSTINPTHGQTEMLLIAQAKGGGKNKEHTSNARPSTQEKHQKGQANKKKAQENKVYKQAKKSSKNKNLDKKTILKNTNNKN